MRNKIYFGDSEFIEQYQQKYGSCDYKVDYDLYPETEGVSDITNFRVSNILMGLAYTMNGVFKKYIDKRQQKELLQQILCYVAGHDVGDMEAEVKATIDDDFELKLILALAARDEGKTWQYLLNKGVEFSMEADIKEHVFTFVKEALEEIAGNFEEKAKDNYWSKRVTQSRNLSLRSGDEQKI